MKTTTATPLATAPTLRIAFPEYFNEEIVREPLAKIKSLLPAVKKEMNAADKICPISNSDVAWFASYE